MPETDKAIAEQLAKEDYSTWIPKLREVLQKPDTPMTFRNGVWAVSNRKELWETLGSRLFDEHLDIFKQQVVSVLTEHDPQFSLPKEERYAASIHGKVLKYSHNLRKGLAESLALLGCYPKALTKCTTSKPEAIATLAVREILDKADWVLWGSLNNLLPLLAEASPDEFLKAVEATLQKTPSPFDTLFSQEGNGITDINYLTGLLWALETLAWDEQYLVQATVILGELASHDPGGTWANRPANSLKTILLPWFPQTTAPIEKRKVAVKTVQKEAPDVAWKLLLSLLPNQSQTTFGAHKPLFRKTIPENWKDSVTQKDYWDQVSFYSDMAVEMAKGDIAKLNELVRHLDNLPKPSFDEVLKHVASKDIIAKPEGERITIWTALVEFATKHKKFADAKWALAPELVKKIDQAAANLAPKTPLNLYRRLFSERDIDLYEKKGDWKEQRERLENRRQQAIREILGSSDMKEVIRFAEIVESPSNVGFSLGIIAENDTASVILPSLIDTGSEKLRLFARGFVWGRYQSEGSSWVNNISMADWSHSQIGQFLGFLPFVAETWERAKRLLAEAEAEYWRKVNVNPYEEDNELCFAIEKLIRHGRPNAAITCLNKILHDKKPIDQDLTIEALLAVNKSSEPSHSIDAYYIVELIKVLQDDPTTDPDALFSIEWAFLPLLDRHHGTSPKQLEKRLSSDPDFFCKMIRILYKSKKESTEDKEASEQEKAVATNIYGLLNNWQTVPGIQPDGSISSDVFNKYLKSVKAACSESGHLEVALTHLGDVLIYSPPDPDGLWICRTVATVLNDKDAEEMRNGFSTGIFNSRGVHWVDPTGKPEKELAAKYKQQADEVENAGYQRLAATLRIVSGSYERDAERIIAEHKK